MEKILRLNWVMTSPGIFEGEYGQYNALLRVNGAFGKCNLWEITKAGVLIDQATRHGRISSGEAQGKVQIERRIKKLITEQELLNTK